MGDEAAHVTRAVVFALDPSPAQDRMLRSYCGAARFAYNWTIAEVTGNLATRTVEREAAVDDANMTSAVSWSKYSLRKQFNGCKATVAPWSGEVAKHCFDTGVTQAARALANWSDSKSGVRAGRRVGFPNFKARHKAKLSVTFVELNHQLSWLNPSRHAVRLMLPQALLQSKDAHVRRQMKQLVWLHTVDSTRRLFRLVEDGRATIQQVTISHTSGRWQVSFLVRYAVETRPVKQPLKRLGGAVGVDVGVTHLATLSRTIDGFTDDDGHVPNQRPLAGRLARLQKLDRSIASCERGSKNRARLLKRRARLHGSVTAIRKNAHHQLANQLAGRFDTVVIEDLNVAGMTHNRPLARALADVGLGQLRQIITTECSDRDTQLVTIDRFYPSSKTCSACGAVKAKLPLGTQVFDCDYCDLILDRDVNAARNLEQQSARGSLQNVAGLRPETRNADPEATQDQTCYGTPGGGCLKAEPSSRSTTTCGERCSGLDGSPATTTSTTADEKRRDCTHLISPSCRA
jgi:putative transposase